jgi:isoleucyl-tRNA synthetase
MPFAQVHYPFDNREWFEHHYPGDFIVEYIGQTRGWFYTLHVLATALFDRPAFSTCVSHGIVLGDDGQKMSKSLNNYPDPTEMFDAHGADAMRWSLLSSSILRGNDAIVTEAGIRDTVRQVLLPLWNSWYFLALYANAADHRGVVRTDSPNMLDRYIMSKTRDLVDDVTVALDAYDLFAACQHVRSYLDVLTNWYVRRSRSRFWQGDHDAIDTMHTVMSVVTRTVAPLLPLVAEAIHQGMTDEGDAGDENLSVHLTDWPTIDELPAFDELVDTMDLVRDVCSATLSVRKAHQRRVRLPLASVTVAAPDAERLRDFVDLIADEVNVRRVELTTDMGDVASEELHLVPAKLGPRLGKDVQDVIRAHKAGDWTVVDGVVTVGGRELVEGEYRLELVASGDRASSGLANRPGVIALDIEVDDELEREGLARDLIRSIQQARREADLDVSDRIELSVTAAPAWIEAIDAHRAMVMDETLSVGLETSIDQRNEPGDPVIVVTRATTR